MGRQVCRVLLSVSYVSLRKRQYDSKRSTSCPDLIPLCISLCGKRGENKGADSNGAKKNEFSWINLWSILWVLKFLRCWNIFAELINGSRLGVGCQAMEMATLSLDSFTISPGVYFARFKKLNSCHPEGLMYVLRKCRVNLYLLL